MSEQIPISGPLGIGELLDRTFRLYRARFAQLLGTAAVLLLPVALISALFLAVMSEMMFTPITAGDPNGVAQWGLYVGGAAIIWLLTVVTGALTELALTYQSGAAVYGQDISIGRSIRSGIGRLLGYIGMRIAQFLALMLVFLPILCVFGFALGGAFDMFGTLMEGAFADGGNIASGLGAMLITMLIGVIGIFIIALPALYIYARWVVAVQCLVFERTGPLDALRRSWELTRNQTLRVLAYTVIGAFLIFIVVGIPLQVVNWVLLILLPTSPGLSQGLSTAIQSLISILWQPLYVGALVFLYYDLRVRRESYDLAARIDQIETASGLQ